MELATLRLLAGFSSDAHAARALGVSPRTWRRWRAHGPPRLMLRLLRYEAGFVPGWPAGWRARADGVEIPGVGLVRLAEIEARAWVWQLVHDQAEAVATHDTVRRARAAVGRGRRA